MKWHSIVLCFAFYLYLIIIFFYIFVFHTLFKHFWSRQISSTKLDPHLCVHRHDLFICKFVHHVLCLFAYFISNCCFQHVSKRDKRVGWLNDRHGCSPILYDTVTIFVWVILPRAFIYYNVHWHSVTLLHYGSLYCFRSLAKSYETINESIYRRVITLETTVYSRSCL